MKLIVHITRDNLTSEAAGELYEEIKLCLAEKWPDNPDGPGYGPYLHVNASVVDKFPGSHGDDVLTPPGEI